MVNLHCSQRDGGFYVAVRDYLKSEFAFLLNVSGGLILIHQLTPLQKKKILSSWAGRIIHFFSHKKDLIKSINISCLVNYLFSN